MPHYGDGSNTVFFYTQNEKFQSSKEKFNCIKDGKKLDSSYNTGNKDFVYDDLFVDKTDGYAHSKWLSFMEKRLLIAKELLSNS